MFRTAAPPALALLLSLPLAAPLAAFDFAVNRFDDPAPDGCLPGDCSLREAVIAANANADFDRVLLSYGTYELTIPGANEDEAATGDVDVRQDLDIVGVGGTMTVIDSSGTGDRTIDAFGAGLAFGLYGVKIVDSDSNALKMGAGTHRIEDCEFAGNGTVSGDAGVTTSSGAGVTIRRSTITGSSGVGLALNAASAVLENVTIHDNGAAELFSNQSPVLSCIHCTIADDVDATTEILLFTTDATFANSVVLGTCSFSSGGSIVSSGGNFEADANGCGFDHGNATAASLALTALAEHGGHSRTLAPTAGSVMLGNGVDGFCLDDDQRGAARAEAACDSGAVEGEPMPWLIPIFADGFQSESTGIWSTQEPL